MRKRYFFIIFVVLMVGFCVWKLSNSYALSNHGYEGNNIIVGNKWGINITDISDLKVNGNTVTSEKISTIGTTLNFDVLLFSKGDSLSFNVTIENNSKLNGELYAIALSGLSNIDSEVIDYQVVPNDYLQLHSNDKDGSVIKTGEKQTFTVTVKYNDSIANDKEYNLNLGTTFIYKQK